MTPVLEMTRSTLMEVITVENQKSELVIHQMSVFDYDSQGLLTLHGRIWMPYGGQDPTYFVG